MGSRRPVTDQRGVVGLVLLALVVLVMIGVAAIHVYHARTAVPPSTLQTTQ